METIQVKRISHDGRLRYFLLYSYSRVLNDKIKTWPDSKYSSTYKAWHVEATAENIQKLLLEFGGLAKINLIGTPACQEVATGDQKKMPGKPANALPGISAGSAEKAEKFRRYMRSRRYSDHTVKTYMDALIIFLRYYSHKAVIDITHHDLIAFNNDYILKHRFSSSYQNQVINAVKLFFRNMENKGMDADLIQRPKRHKELPNVLSKEEVKLILSAHGNLKHKALLSEDGVTYNKTATLDSSTYKSLRQKASITPSTSPPLSFTADDFINNLMSNFTYWTPFYGDHPTTLYSFPNAKSSADSIMVAENSDNKYVFKKVGDKWFMTNFSIKVSGFTLNHVECGQTSKEALNKMGIKIKKPITDGQVWVSNKSGTYKFLLTFTGDKLTRIQL